MEYISKEVRVYTLVNNKVDASGSSTFLKFTQPSKNVSASINSISSVSGGDAGIKYYMSFQLNSYLPEEGKTSVSFPDEYTSLFEVNSHCYL